MRLCEFFLTEFGGGGGGGGGSSGPGGMRYVELTPHQEVQVLMMTGAKPLDEEKIVLIAGENGTLQLAFLDLNGLGPKAVWTGTEWSPL